jgi:hypothetical protein
LIYDVDIFPFIVSQVQNTLISLTLTHLYRFVTEQNKNLILRITIQEFSSENFFQIAKPLFIPSDYYSVICPIQTIEHLHHICSNHQSYPLLITFHLINRSSNINCVQFHILSTNDNNDETTNQDKFSNLLMSLSLSLPSNRQKQSFHLSK